MTKHYPETFQNQRIEPGRGGVYTPIKRRSTQQGLNYHKRYKMLRGIKTI